MKKPLLTKRQISDAAWVTRVAGYREGYRICVPVPKDLADAFDGLVVPTLPLAHRIVRALREELSLNYKLQKEVLRELTSRKLKEYLLTL